MAKRSPRRVNPEFVDMPNECWRPVKDFFGYEVSNIGRVRSRRHSKVPEGSSIPDHIKPRLLRQVSTKLGYLRVFLYSSRSGKARYLTRYVHVLVLKAFVGDPPLRYQCRHLNGCSSDNRLINLKWGTVRENHEDRRRHGTMPVGEKHTNSKLKRFQVLEIRAMAKRNLPYSEIALKYGVGKGAVGKIVRRETWKHVKDPED